MMYYKKNDQIKKINNTEAIRLVEIKSIGDIPREIEIEGKKTTITEKGVVTAYKKYIETISDIWTEEPPPKVGELQRLDLTDEGWVVEDFTKEGKEAILEKEFQKIDSETQEKIFDGFNYDGKRFSMTMSAQANWLYLFTLYESGQFPKEGFSIATKDDAEYVLVKKKAPPFFQAATTHKETALAEGRKRKAELRSQYE